MIQYNLGDGMTVYLRTVPHPHVSLILTYPRETDNGYATCRAMLAELQKRAGVFREAPSSPTFPESRTYQDGHGRFRWEFWTYGDANMEALWAAVDTDEAGRGGFLRLFNQWKKVV